MNMNFTISKSKSIFGFEFLNCSSYYVIFIYINWLIITAPITALRSQHTQPINYVTFRGKEEITGREIRDFMENNKALEKELIEETGVSQIEITKYMQESVHLKEDKRTKLFRWYLEKKLSRMESGKCSKTWCRLKFYGLWIT